VHIQNRMRIIRALHESIASTFNGLTPRSKTGSDCLYMYARERTSARGSFRIGTCTWCCRSHRDVSAIILISMTSDPPPAAAFWWSCETWYAHCYLPLILIRTHTTGLCEIGYVRRPAAAELGCKAHFSKDASIVIFLHRHALKLNAPQALWEIGGKVLLLQLHHFSMHYK
jgi:hypothetical protein